MDGSAPVSPVPPYDILAEMRDAIDREDFSIRACEHHLDKAERWLLGEMSAAEVTAALHRDRQRLADRKEALRCARDDLARAQRPARLALVARDGGGPRGGKP